MRPEELRRVTYSSNKRALAAVLVLVIGVAFQRAMFDAGVPYVSAIAIFASASFILLSVTATVSYVVFEKHRGANDASRVDGGTPLVSEASVLQSFIIREFI